MLDTDDLAAFADAVGDFGEHVQRVLFDPRAGEGPDGDLDAVPELVDQARRLGLFADPGAAGSGADDEARDAAARDYAVWGGHITDDGCGLSLEQLGTLGETCAGLAAAVHAQGIGWLAARAAGLPGEVFAEGATIAAAFVPGYGVAVDPRTFGDAVRLHDVSGRRSLQGSSPAVWAAARPDWVVTAARDARSDRGWAIVAVPADSLGMHLEPVGRRVGIRALHQYRVDFDAVPITPDTHVIATGDKAEAALHTTIACDWLGCAAIALGAARAAYRQAVAYTTTRRQGGAMIVDHAAVRLLLANAAHQIASFEALLQRHALVPLRDLDATGLSAWAVSARLGIAEHAAVAVTDSLQTHGGYGYMDDYGLSKRLRDVQALAVRHGSRDQLLLWLHDVGFPTADPGRVA